MPRRKRFDRRRERLPDGGDLELLVGPNPKNRCKCPKVEVGEQRHDRMCGSVFSEEEHRRRCYFDDRDFWLAAVNRGDRPWAFDYYENGGNNA